jgi:glucokinase
MNCLVADFGGTRIKIGLMQNGRLLAHDILATIDEEPMDCTMEKVGDGLEGLCHAHGITPQACNGFAAGFPALVDNSTNRILDHYGKFPGAPQFDFDGWSARRWGLPVALDNDARLALLGEWQHGAGRGSNHQAIVTLGTGVGSAVLLDGILFRGPDCRGGNLCGHWIVKPNGHPCACGNRGCVEAETGSGSLHERARERLALTNRTAELPDSLDYSLLLELAGQQVDWAVAMRDEAILYWSILCGNMINAFDLNLVVLGGGVMHALDALMPSLSEQVNRFVIGHDQSVRIKSAEHPDTMALLGGEWLIKEKTSA